MRCFLTSLTCCNPRLPSPTHLSTLLEQNLPLLIAYASPCQSHCECWPESLSPMAFVFPPSHGQFLSKNARWKYSTLDHWVVDLQRMTKAFIHYWIVTNWNDNLSQLFQEAQTLQVILRRGSKMGVAAPHPLICCERRAEARSFKVLFSELLRINYWIKMGFLWITFFQKHMS